jgi:protein kinase X
LLQRLLNPDKTRRLGSSKGGAEDVKSKLSSFFSFSICFIPVSASTVGHPWFASINWQDVLTRRNRGPIIPTVRHPGDSQNFEEYPEEGNVRAGLNGEAYSHLFQDF